MRPSGKRMIWAPRLNLSALLVTELQVAVQQLQRRVEDVGAERRVNYSWLISKPVEWHVPANVLAFIERLCAQFQAEDISVIAHRFRSQLEDKNSIDAIVDWMKQVAMDYAEEKERIALLRLNFDQQGKRRFSVVYVNRNRVNPRDANPAIHQDHGLTLPSFFPFSRRASMNITPNGNSNPVFLIEEV